MLVLLSGVSGAGKDTIKKELIARMENVESLPSYTDRQPRENDIPGQTYNFVTTEEFEAMIARGELYEYSAHHNHYYGTSKKLLNEKMQNGKIIVKDIEVNGVENLIKLLKNKILGGYDLGKDYPELSGCTMICVTEKRSADEINKLVGIMEGM